MANGIKIGTNSIGVVYIGSSSASSVYLGTTLLYSGGTTPPTPPTPTGSTCYEVIYTPIESYMSTSYDSVFSTYYSKWYVKNNLNQYEEYGVYDKVDNISTATTYQGKLGVVGTTEYQYSGSSWSVVGTCEFIYQEYTVKEQSSSLIGVELPTTFIIPIADIEEDGYIECLITSKQNIEDYIYIYIEDGSYEEYTYNDEVTGVISKDEQYYYLSLPSEAPQSITVGSVDTTNPYGFHILQKTNEVQATVEYVDKPIPLINVYSSVAEMEAVDCPTVGIGQYGVVGDDVYRLDAQGNWNVTNNYKLFAKYNNGAVNVLYPNSSNELKTSETNPDNLEASAMTSAVIGNVVTSIEGGDIADWNVGGAFGFCSSLSSVTISNGVTNIGDKVFYQCTSLTSIDIPSGVTSIGSSAFNGCTSLSSVTVRATTPPTLGGSVFPNSIVAIYVPSESVETYKSASGWSEYDSMISPI